MVHTFVQQSHVSVHVCLICSYWPDHHVHTGDARSCTCDGCTWYRDILKRNGWGEKVREYNKEISYLTDVYDRLNSDGQPIDNESTTMNNDSEFVRVWMDDTKRTEYTVQKYGGYIPISEELLMDEGLIPDTRPVIVPTRREKISRWTSQKVAMIRIRLGSWIAGVDVRDHDEDEW